MTKTQHEQRSLRFVYDDGSSKDFKISKATVLRVPTKKVLCHIDRLYDGTHLLLCSEEAWPFERKIERIEIIRGTE